MVTFQERVKERKDFERVNERETVITNFLFQQSCRQWWEIFGRKTGDNPSRNFFLSDPPCPTKSFPRRRKFNLSLLRGTWRFKAKALPFLCVWQGHLNPLSIHKQAGHYVQLWQFPTEEGSNQLFASRFTMLPPLPSPQTTWLSPSLVLLCHVI